MRNNLLPLLVAFIIFISGTPAKAQKASVSTNLAGYAYFATLNLEASCSLSRHWSGFAGAKYNPFTFNMGSGREKARARQQTYYAGARYWFWNVYSGWWTYGKVQYQEYSNGGIFSRETREGDRAGLSLGGGHSYMVGKHLNLELGAGIWCGLDKFKKYSCPVCGNLKASGRKFFVLPSDVIIGISYIF